MGQFQMSWRAGSVQEGRRVDGIQELHMTPRVVGCLAGGLVLETARTRMQPIQPKQACLIFASHSTVNLKPSSLTAPAELHAVCWQLLLLGCITCTPSMLSGLFLVCIMGPEGNTQESGCSSSSSQGCCACNHGEAEAGLSHPTLEATRRSLTHHVSRPLRPAPPAPPGLR